MYFQSMQNLTFVSRNLVHERKHFTSVKKHCSASNRQQRSGRPPPKQRFQRYFGCHHFRNLDLLINTTRWSLVVKTTGFATKRLAKIM